MRQATTQQPWNQAIAGGSYSRLRWIFMCCCNLQQNIERFVITRKEQEETTASSDCRRSVLHRRLSTGLRGLGWLHEHNIDAAKQVWFSVRELKNIVRRTKVMFVHAKNTILWADETPVLESIVCLQAWALSECVIVCVFSALKQALAELHQDKSGSIKK